MPEPDTTVHDVVIVGAGPAGLTAGIYASRGRLDTVVLERNMAGGQIAVTELVENYPGFPEGISGFDLSEKMKEQALKFGADLREIQAVTGLERDGMLDAWAVHTDQGPVYGRAVILAPGREPRRSGIPGEAEFIGRGVSWCATCDGALYATASWPSSAAATRPWRRACSSPSSPARCTWCTAAGSCVRPPSPRSAASPTTSSSSSGTRCRTRSTAPRWSRRSR